jgi:hypothetical protein
VYEALARHSMVVSGSGSWEFGEVSSAVEGHDELLEDSSFGTGYRCEEELAGLPREGIRLCGLRSMLPKDSHVATEGCDLGTLNQAYHLPTSSRAKLHRKYLAHYLRNEDILGTYSARRMG